MHIETVVHQAVKESGLCFNDLSAISVTTEPGLPMSLSIGTKYGKYLCRHYKKPFIPIHHMKAHALTARMVKRDLEFPYLVLLVSGGHCLLAIAKSADDFLLLGEVIDNAPGEIMDKIARRLKLKNLREYSVLSGGRAMEVAASKADNPLEFEFATPLMHYRNCNFSFAGLHNKVTRTIITEEKKYNVAPDQVLPSVNNICAGFLLSITRHLCHRIQRAMEFIDARNLILPQHRILVMSGGVACNNIIPQGIEIICNEFGYKLVRPPPKLCTDNGVMIAWNGVERWKAKVGVLQNFDHVDYNKCSPIGESIIEEVTQANLKCKWIKLDKFLNLITNGENQKAVV
ncbi:hypothetical protein WA026_006536 [Henosepilachna vigintioctopunctata]